jgi:hypothetical protein
MSEQAPAGPNHEKPAEQPPNDSSKQWPESDWFKTWLMLARKGGDHPTQSGPSDATG